MKCKYIIEVEADDYDFSDSDSVMKFIREELNKFSALKVHMRTIKDE